jgi:hypothetical protein
MLASNIICLHLTLDAKSRLPNNICWKGILMKDAIKQKCLLEELWRVTPKWLASLLLGLELLTGCTSCAKMKMDAEVDRLCAIDGGIKVYETVSLPPEKFATNGDINFYVGSGGENWLGPEYVWKSKTTYLQPGGSERAIPRMWRSHDQLIRRSDGKLLGESIYYARYGGDSRFFNELIGGPPESHHCCPKGSIDVIGSVFIKMENGKTK